MNPIAALLFGIFVLALLRMPRATASLAVLATICYLTQAQGLIAGGINLTCIRLVLMIAALRLAVSGHLTPALFGDGLGKLIVALAAVQIAAYTLLRGTTGSFIYSTGRSLDLVLSFAVFRGFLSGMEDYETVLAKLAYMVLPFVLFMCVESVTARNMFYVFGGVPAEAWIRDGHVRSMATFRCPITAGTFGAILAPLFAGLYLKGNHRRAAVVGFGASCLIVLTARSSGPLMAFMGGMGVLCLWPIRRYLGIIRKVSVVGLIALQFVMKAPVWFLIARVADVVGGGGYHRAYLIDAFIHRFSSWWLLGTNDTSDWMPTLMWFGGADITNQFVLAGVNGGLAGCILFIAVVIAAFRKVGQALRRMEAVGSADTMLVWSLGASLFGNVLNMFSVSYFDQVEVVFWFVVAAIGVAGAASRELVVIEPAEAGEQESSRWQEAHVNPV